ncbi:MAG: dTDP-4-dehydrorhamnose reductase [bacterium]|nr:dTDP-4-dehydrorhamnose reductase [bacterium]
MSDPRILVVGASGFLGRTICEAGRECIPASRSGQGHLQMDLTDFNQVQRVMEETRPGWVIHAAAMTSVDGCEREPDVARRIHVEGTQNLVRACEKTGSSLIALSTNYVFDGTAGPYGEDDTPHPLNVYGQTKLEAEQITLQAGCLGIVVRTAVLYGYHPLCRPNFVTWAAGALAQEDEIRVVTDEWANPTQVNELAVFILDLCETDFEGVVHFAGKDYLSRFEMVEHICACFHLDPGLVTPITSAELGQDAERPLGAGLQIDRAHRICQPSLQSFEASLRQLVQTIGDPKRFLGH